MIPNNTNTEAATENTPPRAGGDSGIRTIETRFGEIKFDGDNAVRLPRGLLGYAEYSDFCIADLPDQRLEPFKLLQSLSEPDLSFVVAPMNADSGIIEDRDLAAAAEALSIDRENMVALLVVSTRKIGEGVQISVNMRAPIFIDIKNQTGWQFVLPSDRYSIRHVLNQESPADSGGAGTRD